MAHSLLDSMDVDINYLSKCGETPLLISIKYWRSRELIMRILEVHGDINIPDDQGKTPLYMAVAYSGFISHELIKRGAAVNVLDQFGHTPLFSAIDGNNIETTCMLLYYGADANIVCNGQYTPLMFALSSRRDAIAEVLYNYCDDFSFKCTNGYSSLDIAAKRKSPLTIKMIEAGANVESMVEGRSIIESCLLHKSSKPFRMVWPKINQRNLLKGNRPFLLTYISKHEFSAKDWVECLFLIFNSDVLLALMEHTLNHIQRETTTTFFNVLLNTFREYKLKEKIRTEIIQVCLSFGCEVCTSDLDLALKLFGFNTEVEAMLNVANCSERFGTAPFIRFPLLSLILGVYKDPSIQQVSDVFSKQITSVYYIDEYIGHTYHMLNGFRYFSFPKSQRESILVTSNTLSAEQKEEVLDYLSRAPTFPSLRELARGKARIYLHHFFDIKKPYHFTDALNKFDLPQHVIDVLRFKAPLY